MTGALAATLALAGVLAGCAGNPDLPAAPTPTGSVGKACDLVMDALPGTVDRASAQVREPYLATWGSPAIVLRCGVNRPEDLRPTSRCDVIDGVGWFAEQLPDGWRFTTIGRSGYVEVTVPSHWAPEADALVDLAPAVSRMPQVHPCR